MGRLFHCFMFAMAIMMPLSAFALPSTCTVGTNVYYISQAGADTNSQAQAKSKSTPWKHAPYMHSFTGAYSHTAGDCFVFRGGDTWVATDYFTIAKGGSSTSPDYYGVDQSWYTGGSWTRPIFDIQATLPHVDSNRNSNIFLFQANWVTVDNWEIVHGTCSTTGPTSQNYFSMSGQDGIVVTNGYFHAFEPPSSGCGSGTTGDGNGIAVWIYESVNSSSGCDGSFDHNIVDGTDGSGAQGYETIVYDPAPCAVISYNVVHDVCSGFGGNFTQADDNLIANFGGALGKFDCGSQGIHAHAIRSNNDADVYNNAIHDSDGEVIMLNPNLTSGHSSSQVYNNVLWHNVPIAIQTGDNGSNTSGTIEIYNNTIDCDSDGGFGSCIRFEHNLASITLYNEHHIIAASAPLGGVCLNNAPFSGGCGSAATFTYNASNNLFQTQAQAASAGYTNSEQYVFSPTSGSSPTVGIGTNSTSMCNSIMTFLCSDTTYGSSQSGGTLTAPAAKAAARPVSTAWDAGAYLFASTTVVPPTGLAAIVQ